MNERIKELAEQAQIWIADYNGQRWEIDPEKFAELIVQKCALVGLETHGNYDVHDDILKHFGVAE